MILNRNVDNFFAETEQVAFHPGHVVPGIDFTNDPLLQGRLFSYTDTQLIRLGGPNFHEIPVNRSISPVHNNQRDGYHREMINVGKVSYHRNHLFNDTPTPVNDADGGYMHYQEKVEGLKVRARSESFKDHFSQATMFWNSMSEVEKRHIIEAFSFEVGKVKNMFIKQQVVEMFANVNLEMMKTVALKIGVSAPLQGGPNISKASPALSQENTIKVLDTLKVAVILADGFKEDILPTLDKIKSNKLKIEIISDKLGRVKGLENKELEVNHTFLTANSVLFDAIFAIGGNDRDEKFDSDATNFIKEAYMHYKPIGAVDNGRKWLGKDGMAAGIGIVIEEDKTLFVEKFLDIIAAHRHWERKVY